MKGQSGFTLIELMVVIVIIGILSALAIPKMFGVSAKAKAAEAPNIISTWETLQSTYVHERSAAGDFNTIGFKDPTPDSKWFNYVEGAITATDATLTAEAKQIFGECAVGDNFVSIVTVATNSAAHSSTVGTCAAAYTPNF